MLETQYEDILYKSECDLWTLETDIYYILNWEWDLVDFNYEENIISLNNNIKLYDLWLSQYLLEWDDEEYLNSLKDKLESDWVKIEWNFDYNSKKYLILYKPKINWTIKIDLSVSETRLLVDEILLDK